MKKFFALLAVLLLAAAIACAEESEPADTRPAELFDLWSVGPEGRTWLTSVVPVSEGVVITSWSALPKDREHLAVSDGEQMWEAKAVLRDGGGLMALIVFDPENPARYAPFSAMTPGRNTVVSAFTVRYGAGPGEGKTARVLDAADLTWRGCDCMLLTLSDDARQGGVLLDPEGGIAGLIVADYAGGQNRKVALTIGAISNGLVELSNRMGNLYSWGNPPDGYRVTLEQNLMTIDWSEMQLPEKGEGENLYLVLLDAGNSYLNFYPAETDERSMMLLMTPGRIYISGIVACQGTPDDLPERYAVTAVPAADDLTAHRFRPKLTAVAELPENAEQGDTPVPVTAVTEALLRSGRAYFWSASEYEVEETLPNETLLVTLTDPDGCNYRYESVWTYGPEYMNDDVWYISMTGHGLTTMLDSNGYPAGKYRLDFYIGGELADTVTFDLIK